MKEETQLTVHLIHFSVSITLKLSAYYWQSASIRFLSMHSASRTLTKEDIVYRGSIACVCVYAYCVCMCIVCVRQDIRTIMVSELTV